MYVPRYNISCLRFIHLWPDPSLSSLTLTLTLTYLRIDSSGLFSFLEGLEEAVYFHYF